MFKIQTAANLQINYGDEKKGSPEENPFKPLLSEHI